MVKKIIKLKKRPVGKPKDSLGVIAGRADKRAIKKIGKKIKNNTPTNPNLTSGQDRMKNPQGYIEFIYWLATPIDLREIKNQKDFAVKIGVGPDTLSEWKKREGFQDLLMDTIKSLFRERSASVLRAVECRALKPGGNQDAALFFKTVGMVKDSNELKLDVDGDLKKVLEKVAQVLPD